jgi:hypothetical protein
MPESGTSARRRLEAVALLITTAACAWAACLPASAGASTLPEWGRCVSLPFSGPKNGGFKDSLCLKPSRGGDSGRYAWEPISATPDSITTGAEGNFWIENAAGEGFSCRQTPGPEPEGEFTGPQTALLKLHLERCRAPRLGGDFNASCSSAGEPAEDVQSAELEARFGYINSSGRKPTVGWELKPALGGPLFEVTCEGLVADVNGSFVGEIRGADRSTSDFEVLFSSTKKVVVPDALEGMEPASMTLEVEGGTEPASAHSINDSFGKAGGIEFKAVP